MFVPGAASFLAWRYLAREGVGAHQRCLDAGCGTGILTVQLALNGAAHVHAIDIDERAVDNTLANAFRNGVSHQVSAAAADLLPWVPEERYEVIVASLQQQPADPFQQTSTHRPVDYWGRILLDQLLGKLRAGARARRRRLRASTSRCCRARRPTGCWRAPGSPPTVVDVGLFPFPPELEGARTQIRRVEELCDAYHVQLGGHDAMAALPARDPPCRRRRRERPAAAVGAGGMSVSAVAPRDRGDRARRRGARRARRRPRRCPPLERVAEAARALSARCWPARATRRPRG